MSSLSFYVPEDFDPDEFYFLGREPKETRATLFRCVDGLCGAQDCARCNPLSHDDTATEDN